jgi:hypothetical protein
MINKGGPDRPGRRPTLRLTRPGPARPVPARPVPTRPDATRPDATRPDATRARPQLTLKPTRLGPLRPGPTDLLRPGPDPFAQTEAISWASVSRKLLPDGSRNPASMPYGRFSGSSVNSTPRLFNNS